MLLSKGGSHEAHPRRFEMTNPGVDIEPDATLWPYIFVGLATHLFTRVGSAFAVGEIASLPCVSHEVAESFGQTFTAPDLLPKLFRYRLASRGAGVPAGDGSSVVFVFQLLASTQEVGLQYRVRPQLPEKVAGFWADHIPLLVGVPPHPARGAVGIEYDVDPSRGSF